MEWLGVVDAAHASEVYDRVGSGTRTVGRIDGGLVTLLVEDADADTTPALDRLAEPGWAGLLFAGGGADVTALAVADGEQVTFRLVPLDADAGPLVLDWASAHLLRPPGPKTRAKVEAVFAAWHGTPSADEVMTLLRCRVGRQHPWQLLGGATQPPLQHGAWVGEVRVDQDTFRYVHTSGDGFYGIWDWTTPEAPIERWPKGAEGWEASYRRWHELTYAPILATQRLDGPILWRIGYPKLDPADLRVDIVHQGSGGTMFLILARDLPLTMNIATPNSPFNVPDIGHVTVRNLAEFARANDHDPSWFVTVRDWTPLPDDAPRDLLALNAWLLKQRG